MANKTPLDLEIESLSTTKAMLNASLERLLNHSPEQHANTIREEKNRLAQVEKRLAEITPAAPQDAQGTP